MSGRGNAGAVSGAFDMNTLAERINTWANSSEGSSQLLATQETIRIAAEAAEKIGYIDQNLLRKPVTL